VESEDLHGVLEQRRLIRPLLSATDPGDALTSYYALWHDARRTQLVLHYDNQQQPDGFLAKSQTGFDLFRPMVTLRAPDATAAGELLHRGLAQHREYQLAVPAGLAPDLGHFVEIAKPSVNRVFCLDPSRFQPVINVLVQQVWGADGSPRFQIESQGQLLAMSGTNWKSPAFAEVFVYVHPAGRGRGWGRSVVSACVRSLIEAHVQPLYMVEAENLASLHIAEGIGFGDSGAREFTGECHLTVKP
jgi:hypothetical protein